MPDINAPETIHDLPSSIVKNMVTLATSGFGVVVALAWNDFIRQAVTTFIDPYLGKNGTFLSMFIYALVVTLLAIFVTMQLSSVQKKSREIK